MFADLLSGLKAVAIYVVVGIAIVIAALVVFSSPPQMTSKCWPTCQQSVSQDVQVEHGYAFSK
jgi:hypothetical protein